MDLSNKKGFTLIELLIVLGIATIIFGLSVLAVLNIQRGQILENNAWLVVSFLRQAQNQAINGVSVDGINQVNFGIHFDPVNRRYILFQGNSYNPTDPYNFVQEIPQGLDLVLDLPADNNVIFNKITGKIVNYDGIHHQISLRHQADGNIATINFDIMGGVNVQ
jgi:prepilin-type N-terminal cleavage/methylation domain-containing protein